MEQVSVRVMKRVTISDIPHYVQKKISEYKNLLKKEVLKHDFHVYFFYYLHIKSASVPVTM